MTKLDITFKQRTKLKSWGGWVGRTVMTDATKATARLLVTWPIPKLTVVCKKNIFHLFCYTQPVENYPYFCVKTFQLIDTLMHNRSFESRRKWNVSLKELACPGGFILMLVGPKITQGFALFRSIGCNLKQTPVWKSSLVYSFGIVFVSSI